MKRHYYHTWAAYQASLNRKPRSRLKIVLAIGIVALSLLALYQIVRW